MDLLEAVENGKPFSIVPKIDIPDLSRGVLPVQRFGQFIREIRESTVIVPDARIITNMSSYEVDISRISMSVQLEPGRDPNGNKVAPTADEVAIKTNTLNVKELVTKIPIEEETIEDNIEGEQFEQTLVSLLAEGISYDIERFFLLSDTSYTGPDTLLKINDGWMKLAHGQIDEGDLDNDDESWPTNLFDVMMDTIPGRYRQKLPQMKFYVSWKLYKDYRNLLKLRETQMGDTYITTSPSLTYEGIPIQYVPAMDSLGDGKVRALLTVPTNLVYGFWRQVKVVPKPDPEMRRTEYIASMRADCHYEDEEGAVSATIATT